MFVTSVYVIGQVRNSVCFTIMGLILGHVSSKVLGTCSLGSWLWDCLTLPIGETLLLVIRYKIFSQTSILKQHIHVQ